MGRFSFNTNKPVILFLFIVCISFRSYCQDTAKAAIKTDYVLSEKDEIKFPEGQARTQYVAGRNAYNNKDYEGATDLFQKSAALCNVTKFPGGEMLCYYQLAKCYRRIADYPDYQKYLSLLFETATKIYDQEYLAYAYEGFGNLYRYLGDYPKSIENYLESIKISESTGKLAEASMALNNMSIVYEYMGNVKEQLNIQLRNYAILKKLNSKPDLAMSLSNLSAIYLQIGQKAKADEDIQMAMKIVEDIGEKNISFKTLASVYGQNAGLAVIDKNYDKALIYYNKGFDLMKDNKDKKGVSEYYGNLANVYTLMGKDVLAEEFLIKQLTISNEIHYLNGGLTACAALKELKLKQKDYKAASVYMQEYTQIKDSSASEAAKQKIAEAEMRFKFKSGQQELKILSDNIELEEMQAQRKKIIMYAGTAVFLLLSLIAFLLFKAYRHKARG